LDTLSPTKESGGPEKTEAVRIWPIPKNMKQVLKFLGFAGYYRRFVRGFASIARPLNNLLVGHPTKAKSKSSKSAKPAKFVWAEEQQQAFDDLKDRLKHPPVLAYADYSRPFKIHTDASKCGLGRHYLKWMTTARIG